MNWIDKLTKDGGGAGTADLWARVVRKSFLEKAGLKEKKEQDLIEKYVKTI